MKSPFPGMDPFVEPNWRDIHASMMTYARDQLVDQLPPTLIARIEERVVFEMDDEEYSRSPDVHVVDMSPGTPDGLTATAVMKGAKSEPVLIPLQGEPLTERFLEIRDVQGHRLVTVLEIMSVTNKTRGDGLNQYREKRLELRRGGVNLVEIDLLRGGRRGLVWPMRFFPRRARTAYVACITRATHSDRLEAYPMPLRDRLPAIPIPLRKQDQDIQLDLQPIFDRAYAMGRYAQVINYRLSPDPPLEGGDAEWADALLKQAGKR